MWIIYVHWEGAEYQVVRVPEDRPAELVFCDSPEKLGMVLRGLGVPQPEVALVFRQLEVSSDAMVSEEDVGSR